MSKMDKQELKTPDAFLSFGDKVLSLVEKNIVPIVAITTAVILASGGYVAYGYYQQAQELKIQERLFAIDQDLEQVHQDFAKKQEAENKDTKKVAAESADEKPELSAFSSVIEKYKALIAEYPSSNAGKTAAIDLAHLYIEYNQSESAQEALLQVVPSLKPGELFFGLVHTQLGTLLQSQGKDSEALEHFEKVLAAQDQAHLHPDVMLKKGLSLENMNQHDQAIEVYQKLSRDYANTAASQTAKTYLRLLLIKKSLGEKSS